MHRVCVHEKTHGIARSAASSSRPAASGRDTGREPIVEQRELVERRERAEEARELRVVPDDRAVERVRRPRDRLDRLARPIGRLAHERGSGTP